MSGGTPGRNDLLFDAFISIADGLNLDETLRRVVTAAVTLVDARYGALGVIGESGQLAQFVHVGMAVSAPDEIGPLPTGRGLLGQLITEPVPLRLADLRTHPNSAGFPAGHPPMTSFLGVPIRVRDGVFGNLYLTDKRRGEFTEDDQQLTVALAAAAGVAIQNARLFDRNQRRLRWQRAVNAVNALVLSDEPDAAVIAEAARRLRLLTGAQVTTVEMRTADGGLMVVGEDSASPLVPKPAAGLTGTGADVPELVLPLRSGERDLGRVTLRRLAGQPQFNAEESELIEMLVVHTALALSYARERRERERLAVYEERDRIARDLHDLVIQRIFAAGMMLEGVRRTGDLPPAAAARLDRAVDELDATVKEIRMSIFGLNSVQSGAVDVRARVVEEIERAAQGAQHRPALMFDGALDAMVSGHLADHIVAVVREGLSNARRHAGDGSIAVSVHVGDDEVVVSISDDGPGLPEGGLPRLSGLANLEQRARQVDGGCELRRGENGGTLLRWWAPLR